MAKLEIDVLQIEIDTALADMIRELEARAEKAEKEASDWKERVREWHEANHRIRARIQELYGDECPIHGFKLPCPSCAMVAIDAGVDEPAPAGDCKHEQITYAAGGYFCDRCGEMVTVDAPAGDALAGEALGAKLIAWAAVTQPRRYFSGNYYCYFCGKPEPIYENELDRDWHAPDCLHVAARKLQERGDE